VGLFTLPLARKFDLVIGIESNATAARLARRNLENAELSNGLIVSSRVTEGLQAHRASLDSVDFLLLDPPRSGVEPGVIEEIQLIGPREICYVSCDPATLARDLKKLFDGGYSLDSIAAFDMFPQTHHVETVVHLARLPA
jgi:23S rRNA (uracil1939-C5)-methyltransferase